MAVTQISVFLENKLGRLQQILSTLGEKELNIRALSLADTAEYGILRIIVNDTETAFTVLNEGGFSVKRTPVIAVEVEDKPGGLAAILKLLTENSVNIEYIYAFVEKSNGKAVVVLRTENIKAGEEILKTGNIKILEEKDISAL
jgi:hypothetical protein